MEPNSADLAHAALQDLRANLMVLLSYVTDGKRPNFASVSICLDEVQRQVDTIRETETP